VDSKLKRKFAFVDLRKPLKDQCRGRCVVAGYRGNLDAKLQRLIEKEMENFRSYRILGVESKSIKLAKFANLLKIEKTYNHKVGLLCLDAPAGGAEGVKAGYLSVGEATTGAEISEFLNKCSKGEEMTSLDEYPELATK
jgi:hypothetical protein